MESQQSETFRVAGWTVHPASSRLYRDGEEVQLAPKTMEVLQYLSHHAGEVVTREDLEATVWEGRVVGYDAVTNAVGKIRKAFADDRKSPQVIETLSKKGYRLVADVDFSQVAADLTTPGIRPSTAGDSTETGLRPRSSLKPAVLTASIIAIAVIAWLILALPGYSPVSTPDYRRSIAVLPFSNNSDEQQAFFAEGITDDLIAGLARNRQLLVIARDSSFQYQGSNQDLHQIADRLKVRYILHGGVQRSGDRLRIRVYLTEAGHEGYLWSEIYEDDVSNMFAVQNKITEGVLGQLPIVVSSGKMQDLGVPQTADHRAYDAFLQGRQRFYLYLNKDENQRARELFERAISFDDQFAMAYAMLAWTHAFDAMNGWARDRDQSLMTAIAMAGKALQLKKEIPLAHFVTGLAYRERGEYVKAMAEVEKAIELDPNYANAHLLSATLLYYAGLPIQGLQRVKKAIRLNPHHPYNYTFHLGQAYYVLGRYDEAIDAFTDGLGSNPGAERLHVWLAAALAQRGDLEDARWEAEQVLINNSAFSVAKAQRSFPFKDQNDLDHFVEGLRKAGFK